MAKQRIDSREYKIMLHAGEFGDYEGLLFKRAAEFWADFVGAIEDVVVDTDGDLHTIEPDKRRRITFYDTTECRLNKEGYIFRERVEELSGDREVTLKFRDEDRDLVEDRDMSAKEGAKGAKKKFEVDVKPGKELYSFSTKQRIPDEKYLNKMDDPGRLYPGLAKKIRHYIPSEPIVQIGPTFRELVVTGAKFRISKDPKVEAGCALVVWSDGETTKPALAEFSFKYDEDVDEPGTRLVCKEVLLVLQKDLTQWVNPESMTKTAYVFSLAPPGCR